MWAKSGQIGVPERFFEKISRNTTDTEKIMMANIIGNFVAVFGMEVLPHHPQELLLLTTTTNFHQVS